jgi:exopolysaccharide production protein ExoQ
MTMRSNAFTMSIEPSRADIACSTLALALGSGGLARFMAHFGGGDVGVDSQATQLVWIAMAAFSARRLASTYRRSRWWNRLDPSLVALVLWSMLTTLWSIAPDVTARRAIALALTIVIGAHLGLVVGRSRMQLLIVVVCTGTVAASFLGLITNAFVTSGDDGSFIGMFTHRNTLGFVAAVGLIATYRFSEERNLFVWAARGLLMAGLIMADSRTSQVALVVSLTVLALGRLWYLAPRVGVAALSFTAAFLVWLFASFDGWRRFTASIGKDENLTGRGELWGIILNEAQTRPLGGIGFGALWVEPSPIQQAVTERFPELGSAHNIIIDFYAATGLVGAAILIVLLGRVWWPEYKDFRLGINGAGVCAGLLTFFVVRGFSEAGLPAQNSLPTLILVAIQVSAARQAIARGSQLSESDFGRSSAGLIIASGRVRR